MLGFACGTLGPLFFHFLTLNWIKSVIINPDYGSELDLPWDLCWVLIFNLGTALGPLFLLEFACGTLGPLFLKISR